MQRKTRGGKWKEDGEGIPEGQPEIYEQLQTTHLGWGGWSYIHVCVCVCVCWNLAGLTVINFEDLSQ